MSLMSKNKRIIIMCGGRGSRMGRLTSDLPKPLVEINNKPIITYKIENYIKQGFDNITLALGYKKNKVINLVDSFPEKIRSKINFSFAGESVGILERLYVALKDHNYPTIITYGDTITNINLNQLYNHHIESDNKATIVVASIMNPFGLVEYSQSNKVTVFKEKPLLNYFIGYFVINSEFIKKLKKETICLPDGTGVVTIFHNLIKEKKLGSYFYDGEKITFNTPSELELAKKKIINFYTSKEV